MLPVRLLLVLPLLLGACAADPRAGDAPRDLAAVLAGVQAGVRAGDPALVGAVLAPTAEAEVAQRVVYLLSEGYPGDTGYVRERLLSASAEDLEPADDETDAAGRVSKLEASRREPAADGLPPFDAGMTLYFVVQDGRAGLYDTLIWSRRVDGAGAGPPAPQTLAGLVPELVRAVEARDADGLASLVDPALGERGRAEAAATILRWAHAERYAAAFRAALARADASEIASPSDGTPRLEFAETAAAFAPKNYVYLEERADGAFVTGIGEGITPDADLAALRATLPRILAALRAGDADALAGLTSLRAEPGVARAALRAYGPDGYDRGRFESMAALPASVLSREEATRGVPARYGLFPPSEEDEGGVWLYLTVEDGRALLHGSLAVG